MLEGNREWSPRSRKPPRKLGHPVTDLLSSPTIVALIDRLKSGVNELLHGSADMVPAFEVA
jgi:hypothetical protein